MSQELEQQYQPQNGPETPTPEEELGRAEREALSRRGFLRLMGGAAALFAVEGCASIGATGKDIERTAELIDRREAFVKRWKLVLEEGVKKFEADQEMIKRYGPEGVAELAGILRNFDIDQYINTLARIANIRPEEIGGEILSFKLLPTTKKGTMAAVRDLRHMELYLGEWMRWKNEFHAETISTVLRHELAHIFSFDYNAPLGKSIPFVYVSQDAAGWEEKTYLGRTLYEGATEVVAQAAAVASGGKQSVEQGYRGGATLSAYVLSELLGRGDFLKAYLRRDTRLLKTLFDAKIGIGAAGSLTMPVNIGADIFNPAYNDSLDFLHNAFRSSQIDHARLEQILKKAGSEGIRERAQHFEIGGVTITTHLYRINDADEAPRYAFNAVVDAPRVYRFGKPKDQWGPALEGFGMIVVNTNLSEENEKLIEAGATSLKNHCEISDPRRSFFPEAHTIIGYDEYVESKLRELDQLKEGSSEFESVWQDINTHMVKFISDTIKTIYDRAGVSDLVYEDNKDH